MLCSACKDLLHTASSTPQGIWRGLEPSLFECPLLPDAWAGAHHDKPGTFLSAIESQCYICCTIFRDCESELSRQAHSFHTFYQLRLMPADADSQRVSDTYNLEFTIEIRQGIKPITKEQAFGCSGTFKIVPKQEVVVSGPLVLTENTFSGECEDTIRKWLYSCSRDHKQCNQHTCSHDRKQCNQDCRTGDSFPSRLLNVATDEKITLHHFDKSSARPHYVTLSHCWMEKMPLRLTSTTQESLERGLHIKELPLKFQEAIQIARWMRVDFIWIDALCIRQDSPKDWLEESVRVGDIYTNSYCNIAATNDNPDKGCFVRRCTEMVEPYAIPNPRFEDPEETHVIGYDDFWSNSLLDSRLHNRGWVLQERMLSPRTIHFGQEQIFWECRRDMACEAYPDGIPNQFRNHKTRAWRRYDRLLDPKYNILSDKPSHQLTALATVTNMFSRFFYASSNDEVPTDFSEIHDIWTKTIMRYMECDLTYSEDKLVAISGIAQKVGKAIRQPYIAGLWQNSRLAESLLWYVLGRKRADGKPSIRSASAGSRTYRAPSWSWASVDAQVIWKLPADCCKVLANIVSTDVQELEGSRMGRVSSASMKVTGSLFEGRLQIANRTSGGAYNEDGSYFLHSVNRVAMDATEYPETVSDLHMEPMIYLDTPLLPEASSIGVYLLPICIDWKGRGGRRSVRIAGLLLKKHQCSGSENVYERIGIFGLDHVQAAVLCGISADQDDEIEQSLSETSTMSLTIV